MSNMNCEIEAMIPQWNQSHQFVILRGLIHNNFFYSLNNVEHRKGSDGSLLYEIVDYADNEEDAVSIVAKHYIKKISDDERKFNNV